MYLVSKIKFSIPHFKQTSLQRLLQTIMFCCSLIAIGGCQTPTQSQSQQTIVSLHFDDQHISIFENAFPILARYGFSGVNFINSAFIGNPNCLTWEHIEMLQFQHGWETGGHTLHHAHLPDLSPDEIRHEVIQDYQNLCSHQLAPQSFALPNGHAQPAHYDIIRTCYSIIRSSQDRPLRAPVDPGNIGYFAFISDYSAQTAITRIQSGIRNHEALIIIGFHRILPEANGFSHNCRPTDLEALCAFLSEHEIPVKTLKEYFNHE